MYTAPRSFHLLMEKLTTMTIAYLNAQIRHGAQAVQVFDSWVGCLSASDYREFVAPHMTRLFASLDPSVPHIHFAVDSLHLLHAVAHCGGDVIGVDWRAPLDHAWELIGSNKGIQGNLEPVALFGPALYLEEQVRDVLSRANNRPGHIFNLGHGILQGTPVDRVELLIDLVHGLSERSR